MSRHHRFGPLDALAAASMNLLWGLNIIAMKIAVGALGPFTTGAVRFVLLSLLCLPWLRHAPERRRLLILLGLINGGLFVALMNLSLKVSSNVGALAIVGQLCVPIGVVLGIVFLHEKVTRAMAAGIVLGFAGVAAMLFDRRIASELPGMALMLGAASCFATSSLIQRRLAGVPPLTIYAWTGLMGLLVFLPLSLAIEPGGMARLAHLDVRILLALAFSVLGATMLGQGSMAWLLGRHPMSLIMPLTLAATLVSVIASHLVFGTPITVSMLVGGSVALAGILIVTIVAPRPQPPIEA